MKPPTHASRLSAAGTAAAFVVALAAPAAAERRPILIPGFTADADVEPADLPARLTAAMGEVAGADGARVLTQSSRDDLLAIAGCASPDPACLGGALEMLEVERIVLGAIAVRDGGVTVQLTRIDAGGDHETRAVELAAAGTAAMVEAFAPAAAAFLRGEPPPAAGPVPRPAAEPPPAPPVEGGAGSSFSFDRVEPWSWTLAGGGLALAGLGAVFLASAGGVQDAVDAAPTATAADLERLADLEASGRRRALFGSALAVTGLVASAVGVVFVVRQGRARERPPAVAVRPTLLPGGAGLTLAFGGTP